MKNKSTTIYKSTTIKRSFMRSLSFRQSKLSLVLLMFILFDLFLPSLSMARKYYRHFKHHYKHGVHHYKKRIHKRYRKVVYRKRYRYRHYRHYRRYVVRRPVVIHPKNVNPVSKEKDVRIQELLNGQ